MPGSEDLIGLGTFVAILAISFLVKEKLYPFSVLGMFTYPYQKLQVILLGDATGRRFFPTLEVLGIPTSALSCEYMLHVSRGGAPSDFAKSLQGRLHVLSNRPAVESYRLWLREISVETGGQVIVSQKLLPTPPLSLNAPTSV